MSSTQFAELKEVVAKVVSFWAKPSAIDRLDTICSISHVERSKVLRLLVDIFLNDVEFQERVLRGVRNG